MLKSLDIEPTTICNLDCPFCFGPVIEKRSTEINIKIWENALIEFKNLGVENIVISGGEPLLYSNILELVRFLKCLDYNIVLSTHGRKKKILFEVAKYCDWISLPIDGISTEMINSMRTDNYSNLEILKTAKELKMKYENLRIKIGTVATKRNLDEILKVGELLQNNAGIFDTWKIYQYTPRRKYKNLKDSLIITDNEFQELSDNIRKYVSAELKVVYSSNVSRQSAYVFIYHNGDVNLVNAGSDFEDLLVGNIERFNDINLSKINSVLSPNHLNNYNNTY